MHCVVDDLAIVMSAIDLCMKPKTRGGGGEDVQTIFKEGTIFNFSLTGKGDG